MPQVDGAFREQGLNVRLGPTLMVAALIVLFIVLPAQLALNSPWRILVQTGPIVFLVVAGLCTLAGSHVVRIPRVLLLMTTALLLVAVASVVAVGHPQALLVYGGLLAVFYAVGALAFGMADRVRLIRYLLLGAAVSGILVIVGGLAVEPFGARRYQGLFNNPNSMGWLSAGLLHLTLGALYGNRLKFSRWGRGVLWAAAGLAALMLFASNSRTALASVVAILFLFGLLTWLRSVHWRKFSVSRRGLRKLVAGAVVALLGVGAAWYAGLLSELIEKFRETHQAGDVAQGRVDAWIASLRHWNWLGYGPDYAAAIGREGMVIGHSTWINQLSAYGVLNAVLFMSVFGYAAFWAWRAARRETHPGAVVLLSVVVGFGVNASFETGTSTPGMWLAIILFAICLQGGGYVRDWTECRTGLGGARA